jgi:hypothetical protein
MLYDPITPTFCHPERQRPRQHANYTSVQIDSSSQKLQDGFELEASVNYRSVMPDRKLDILPRTFVVSLRIST